MTKQLYLKQLRLQLRGLSQAEIDDIIKEYNDYFVEAEASGLSEEEVIDQLGSPAVIAQEIKRETRPNRSTIEQILVVIALIFLNLTIVIGPVLGIIGSFFGVYFATVVLTIAPLLVIVSMLFGEGHVFELFLSFVLAGVSFLLYPVWSKFAGWGSGVIKQYINWNKGMVRGDAK